MRLVEEHPAHAVVPVIADFLTSMAAAVHGARSESR
jgi:hypothetical protein